MLAGLVFFGEYAEMDDTQIAMFPVGIVLTVIGVYFLSLRGVDESTLIFYRQSYGCACNASCCVVNRSIVRMPRVFAATPPHLAKSTDANGAFACLFITAGDTRYAHNAIALLDSGAAPSEEATTQVTDDKDG